jgi:hypothetical protein
MLFFAKEGPLWWAPLGGNDELKIGLMPCRGFAEMFGFIPYS